MACRGWTMGLIATLFVVAGVGTAEARQRWGCSDPCGTGYVTLVPNCQPYYSTYSGYSAPPAYAAPQPVQSTPQCQPIDSASATLLQVELVPTYVMEKRVVCTTEYRDEERKRVVTNSRTVPITEERYRVTTVMVPKTETKTIEYTQTVPQQTTATKTYTIKVPVYRDVEETYSARIPVLKEMDETYTAKVPVLRDVEFTYTVNVPYPVTNTVQRTVTSAVPVVKTHTISHCVPVTSTKTVKVDRGHWENRMVEVACYSGYCGRRRGCGCGYGCGTMVVCKQVWVPNCVLEEVTSVEQQKQSVAVEYLAYEQQTTTIPYECTQVCFRPESRTGTKKEVAYQDQTLTRKRTIVEYLDEPRKRMKKELSFQEETRTETYPVINYVQEKKTKDYTYTTYVPESKVETYQATRNDTIQEQKIETYTARVAVPAMKEVEVQVCKMVPKVVSINLGNPCQQGRPAYSSPYGGGWIQAPPAACCQ